MAKNNKRPTSWATLLFYGVLALTILVYILRGFKVLSMLPGGVIWFLIILSIAAGVLATLVNLRRSY